MAIQSQQVAQPVATPGTMALGPGYMSEMRRNQLIAQQLGDMISNQTPISSKGGFWANLGAQALARHNLAGSDRALSTEYMNAVNAGRNAQLADMGQAPSQPQYQVPSNGTINAPQALGHLISGGVHAVQSLFGGGQPQGSGQPSLRGGMSVDPTSGGYSTQVGDGSGQGPLSVDPSTGLVSRGAPLAFSDARAPTPAASDQPPSAQPGGPSFATGGTPPGGSPPAMPGVGGAGAAGGAPTDPFPVAAGASPSPGPAPAQTPPPGASPSSPPTTSDLSGQLTPNVIRAIVGEAEDQGPRGQAAVLATMINRARASGMSLDQVATEAHQYAGLRRSAGLAENDPRYQAALQAVLPLARGQAQDPTGGATHFYAPAVVSAPSWAQGQTPVAQIGGHTFFKLPFSAPGGASAPPDAPQPPAGPVPSAGGGVAPVASSPSRDGSDFTPDASAVRMVNGVAYGAAPSAEEMAHLHRLWANPITAQEGDAYAAQLQGRMWGRINPEYQIEDKDGVVSYVPKMPGVGTMRHATIPGYSVAAGPRMVQDGQGGFKVAPGTELGAPQVIPGTGKVGIPKPGGGFEVLGDAPYGKPQALQGYPGLWQADSNGQLHQVASPEYSPAALAELRNSVLGSQAFKDWQSGNEAWEAMKANALKPGGMSGYALRDTFARVINPAGAVRLGTMQAIEEMQGLPEDVKAFFRNMRGDSPVSPQLAQQILNAALPFVQAHYNSISALNNGNAAYAKRHGLDPADVTADIGQAPQAFTIPAGKPGSVWDHVDLRPIGGQQPRQAQDGNWYVPDPQRPGKYLKVEVAQ